MSQAFQKPPPISTSTSAANNDSSNQDQSNAYTPPHTPTTSKLDFDELVLRIVRQREDGGTIYEFSDELLASFGPVSEQNLNLAFSASRSQNVPIFTAASTSVVIYQNSACHYDVAKRLSQIESRVSNPEPNPKRPKKVVVAKSMYQLNPSKLTTKEESILMHPDFRLGNLRSAAIETGIFYRRNGYVGINEEVRKTVVYLMAQLFKPDTQIAYSATHVIKNGKTKFPVELTTKIVSGIVRMIDLHPDAESMGFRADARIPEEEWTQLAFDEINHALQNSPTRNTKKPIFKFLPDAEYRHKLELDLQASRNKWYDNENQS